MKKIGEIKDEFTAAKEADWQSMCNQYREDSRSGVQKLILHASQSRVCNPYDALLLLLYLFFLTKCLFLYENRQDLHLVYFILSF